MAWKKAPVSTPQANIIPKPSEIEMRRFAILATFAAMSLFPVRSFADAPFNVVAADNFYGDITQQIGGPSVKVISIAATGMSNDDIPQTLTNHRGAAVMRCLGEAEIAAN
jgi:hypothetical protein